MTSTAFAAPPAGAAGFDVLAGRDQGLRRLMVIGGRLLTGMSDRCMCTRAMRCCALSAERS
jgi:hypothetical protein